MPMRSLSRLVAGVMLCVPVLVIDGGAASAHGAGGAPATEENFERLRGCESGGDYSATAARRYFGAYQFSVPTWRSLGYGGLPHAAAPEVQDEAARRLQARDGWGPWSRCSRRLGLS